MWTFRSFRTQKSFQKVFILFHREEPCCVTTHWTQLTYRFHGRTVQPFLPSTARGCDEPTSRCQTNPSIRTLGINKPVIPGVSLIRWSTFFPLQNAGSLPHTFVIWKKIFQMWFCLKKTKHHPARHVCLTVRHGYWVVRLLNLNRKENHTLARPWYFFRGLRPR